MIRKKHVTERARVKRFASVFMAVVMVLGLIPGWSLPNAQAGGGVEDGWLSSWQASNGDVIEISSMAQLFEELHKDTSGVSATYYRLTKDIFYETEVEYYNSTNRDDEAYGVKYASGVGLHGSVQCNVGAGKKFLEMNGYDIHYKNDANCENFGGQYTRDSLTFFELTSGADLTISNSRNEGGKVWYDGWMNATTGFISGPQYVYTASRDVFHVKEGAELTLNNVKVKAGRNRRYWMVNAYNIDKIHSTNLIASLIFNGHAYEQIYGSAIVVDGGKVTINGGYIEGRGGKRDGFNVSGGGGTYLDCTMYTDEDEYEDYKMVKKYLTDVGPKACVQITKNGSEVIINDGEFWANGGANIIGLNPLDGGWDAVTDYKLEIHAGTFDTSKADKERLPDHCASACTWEGSGVWIYSGYTVDFWQDCHCIRSTPRGYIGFQGTDGQGNSVVDFSKVQVFIDKEDAAHEVTDAAGMNFKYKSDSDTIIIKPKETINSFSNVKNYKDQRLNEIYATSFSGDDMKASSISSVYEYERGNQDILWFTVESRYNLTDLDNPYFVQGHTIYCTWTLHEPLLDGLAERTQTLVTSPAYTYQEGDKTYYVFRTLMDDWKRIDNARVHDTTWEHDVTYYMTASVTEALASSQHTLVTHTDNAAVTELVQGKEYEAGLEIEYPCTFKNDLDNMSAAITYSNAFYGDDPVISFSGEMQELMKGKTFYYQWQKKQGKTWQDYGNSRISMDEAKNVLNKHSGLIGETVRLKLTSYDGSVQGEIYSNSCEVQKGRNDDGTALPNFSVKADEAHTGKYVLTITANTDMQEYLVLPNTVSAASRKRTLDWSGASNNTVYDNLAEGNYTVFYRFMETENLTAGSVVGYRDIYIGTVVETKDTQIRAYSRPSSITNSYSDTMLSTGEEYYMYPGEIARFSCLSVPADATNDYTQYTKWNPDYGKRDIITPQTITRQTRPSAKYVFEDTTWPTDGSSITGSQFAFKAAKVGTVTLNASTQLSGYNNIRVKSIRICVLPDSSTPYEISVNATDAEMHLSAGQTFEPIINALPNYLAVQERAKANTVWSMYAGTGSDIGHFTLNEATGAITVSEDALEGESVIVTGTYLDNNGNTVETPHGLVQTTYKLTVVSSEFQPIDLHEGEAHTMEHYRALDESQHLASCGCGYSALEAHHFDTEVVATATYGTEGVMRYICRQCGYSYEVPIEHLDHEHSLYYVYDDAEHWLMCDDEDCPYEDYEEGRGTHDFVVVGTSDDGEEIYGCSVCGCIKAREKETLDKRAPLLAEISAGDEGVTLVWNPNIGVSSYTIFRKTGKESWKKLADTVDTTYLDRTVASATTYSYTVRGKDENGKYVTDYDKTGLSVTTAAIAVDKTAPKLESATYGTGGATITWKLNAGVEKYTIFRKLGSSAWAKVGESTGNTYLDSTALAGKAYYYTVRGMNAAGKYITNYDKNGIQVVSSVIVDKSAPQLESITAGTDSITLTWKANEGVTGYVVFRKTGKAGWTKLATVEGTSYEDKTAEANVKYFYTVRGVDLTTGKYITNYDQNGLSATIVQESVNTGSPVLLSAVSCNEGILVTWEANAGVPNYTVFRKSEGGKWTVLGETGGTNYLDDTAEIGSTYSYTVRGKNAAGKYVTSYDTTGITATREEPAEPEVLDASAPVLGEVTFADGAVTLTWTANGGVDKYTIFRKIGSGKWEKLCETTGTGNDGVKARAGATCSYTDSTVESGVTYTYTVRGMNAAGKYVTVYDTTGKTITIE